MRLVDQRAIQDNKTLAQLKLTKTHKDGIANRFTTVVVTDKV